VSRSSHAALLARRSNSALAQVQRMRASGLPRASIHQQSRRQQRHTSDGLFHASNPSTPACVRPARSRSRALSRASRTDDSSAREAPHLVPALLYPALLLSQLSSALEADDAFIPSAGSPIWAKRRHVSTEAPAHSPALFPEQRAIPCVRLPDRVPPTVVCPSRSVVIHEDAVSSSFHQLAVHVQGAAVRLRGQGDRARRTSWNVQALDARVHVKPRPILASPSGPSLPDFSVPGHPPRPYQAHRVCRDRPQPIGSRLRPAGCDSSELVITHAVPASRNRRSRSPFAQI